MTALTRYTISSFLIGLSLFGACKSTESIPAESLPTDQVMLSLNRSARVGTDITVQVDSLSDGRCPSNGQCIWEGIAHVSGIIATATAQRRFSLYLNSTTARTRQDSTGITLSGQMYKVILRNVSPYPDGNNYGEQKATIQVAKL